MSTKVCRKCTWLAVISRKLRIWQQCEHFNQPETKNNGTFGEGNTKLEDKKRVVYESCGLRVKKNRNFFKSRMWS